MSFFLNLLAVYFINHFQECCSHYSEWTTNRMRSKLYAMERELIKDAMQKIKSIQHMKTLYSKTHSYQIADRIFFIRRKFARMMRVYTIGMDNLQYQRFLLGCMEEINYLSMDIDHLVEMVTEFEKHHASDLIDLGGLILPADILSPSNIGGDLAKILGNAGQGGPDGPGGMLPPIPSSTDIPGFPHGLPSKPPSEPAAPPHGPGGRPVVLRVPSGAGIIPGRYRGIGRPIAHNRFKTSRDPFY